MEKIIDIKNTQGDLDTKATIIHQNNINYTPKVSVIIPVYNTEKYLRECLDSIVNQTLKEIEIICVDDGSTDSSLDILKEYANKDNRFTIITQQNLHAGVARNAGLAVAKGEYVHFLDSDDYVKQNIYTEIYDRITKLKANICIFKNDVFDLNENRIKPCVWEKAFAQIKNLETFNSAQLPKIILQVANTPAFTKLYEKNFLEKNNIKFQSTRVCNDVYFNNVSLILAEKITSLDESLVIYRHGHSNLSKTRDKYISCALKAHKKVMKTLKSLNKFEFVKESVYKKISASFSWELENIKNSPKRLYWAHRLYSILPKSYGKIEIKNASKLFIRDLFSITNSPKHKILSFMGIKIKFKRKNVKTPQVSYRKFDDLGLIIKKNISKIPSDVSLIVGIPRSGIIPAYMISLFLNKKVCSINEFINGLECGHGYREIPKNNNDSIETILIVDDSVNTGRAINEIKQKIEELKLDKSKYRILYCAIFATKASTELVDIYFEIVNKPRIFQWNYLNHLIAESSCYDIDGVLCEDPTNEQNDDGEKYIDFILNAKPLFIPSHKINSLVTSRLEKYRPQTEEWLRKHNVKYKNLYMLNVKTAEERRKLGCHASFKARIYKKKKDCLYFIESNPKQAQQIHEYTGKTVICVETDEIFQGVK